MTHLATLQITSITGAPLTAIRLPPYTWAGIPNAVSNVPMVEFYDTRFDHTNFGQFVSRYTVEQMLTMKTGGRGLNLDGNSKSWSINGATFDTVIAWLKEF